MSGDTVRPLHITNKLFLMETSESSWDIYDLRTKLNKWVKQLFQIQNRLAVTANQTLRQSRQTGSKPVLSKPLTYHSQTWYIDSWHHSGDTQTIWWPLTSGGLQTGNELISLQGLYVSKPNLAHSLMTLSWWWPNNWASSTPSGGVTIHVFVLNRISTDVTVRCMDLHGGYI